MKKCRDCGSSHEEKTKLCAKCSARARATVDKRRAKLNGNGLCGQCGNNKNEEGKVRCEQCNKKINIASADRAHKNLANNCCVRCGRSRSFVSAWHTTACAGCHLKYKFAFTGTKEDAEKLINDMLNKQNFKCALTGRCLRTNKFHIDHIVPRSIGGLNDASNLQLIVDEANVFKTNLSMEQVIILAKDIVEKARNDGKL